MWTNRREHFQVREVKVTLEMNGGGRGNVRHANLTNGGIPIGKLITIKGEKGMMSIVMIGGSNSGGFIRMKWK